MLRRFADSMRRQLGSLANLAMGAAVGAAAASLAFMVWASFAEHRNQLESFLVNGRAEAVDYEPLAPAQSIHLVDYRSGQHATLDEVRGSRCILAFMTSVCPYCKITLQQWAKLARSVSDDGVPVVVIALDGGTDGFDVAVLSEAPFDVWMPRTQDDRRRLGVSTVPLTVYTSRDGNGKAWRGVLRIADVTDVEQTVKGLRGKDPSQ
jgi:hypothetical protein